MLCKGVIVRRAAHFNTNAPSVGNGLQKGGMIKSIAVHVADSEK